MAASARGLFRATGNKSKPVHVYDLEGNIVKADALEREADDAPPMLNGWFVWDRKHVGETVLRMLDRKDARQGELFGGQAA